MSTPRIGIDLGGTKIEGVILAGARADRGRRRVATPRLGGGREDEEYAAILRTIAHLVADLEGEAGARCRVGIGTPGAWVAARGAMKNCNTTSLNGRPLREDLERTLGREVRVANDANCFAVSEALDGAAEGHRVVFGVILGTGVGGGIVMDGRVHAGPNGIAGEWGHVSLAPDGPECYCGKRGCVETYLSGPGFAADYRRHGGEAAIEAPEIAERAAEGDPIAREAMARYVDRFGRAVAMLASALDPDCIVLGGGMSALDRLYTDGPTAAARHAFGGGFETPIVRNRHGDSSGVRGAAMLWPEA